MRKDHTPIDDQDQHPLMTKMSMTTRNQNISSHSNYEHPKTAYRRRLANHHYHFPAVYGDDRDSAIRDSTI